MNRNLTFKTISFKEGIKQGSGEHMAEILEGFLVHNVYT